MSKKLVSEEFIIEICKNRNGKKICYTSGAFDIIHAGHVDYLQQARAFGDMLIVRLNSDKSIKEYKDKLRPIVGEENRALVLSGLESVDYVFISDDLDNQKMIEILKPDFYVKSTDNVGKLKSAPIVESYGGQIKYIDFKFGHSSSNIMSKILEIYGYWNVPERKKEEKPAVFLDRDGTIVKEINYLHEPEKVELLPGITDKLLELQKTHFIIIITNQPGIGLGYFTKEDFFRTNLKMFKLLSAAGVKIDKIYFCPHSESEKCDCRKPKTLMLDRAFEELPIIKENSFMFGDRAGDMKAGKALGLKTILIKSAVQDGAEEYSDLVINNWQELSL